MQKLHILNDAKGGLGGGWSFVSNFHKAFRDQLVNSPEEADVLFIPAASMVQRQTVEPWLNRKKFVLRVDNLLKDSRNRGTGMSRMRDYAAWSDLIVFQSEWARGFLGHILGYSDKHRVILNGSDPDIFTPQGESYERDGTTRYLYTRTNRDDSKQPHMAFQSFQEISREQTNAVLWVVGQFSPEMQQYGFDLGGLPYRYFGQVDQVEMAKIMRSCNALLYSYFSDACSNTLSEAMLSGLDILDCYGMIHTGGAFEQIEAGDRTIEMMAEEYRKLFETL